MIKETLQNTVFRYFAVLFFIENNGDNYIVF